MADIYGKEKIMFWNSLIYKLNFLIVYLGSGIVWGFRYPLRVLECIPLEKKWLLYTFESPNIL